MGSLVFIPPSSVPDGPPAATINIYVATTGSDANPGTIAAPKLTMAGAWAELPPVQSGNFIMHLASGNYVFSAPPANTQEGRACCVIYGDGAGQGVDDGFTVVATGSLTVGTTSVTLVVTGGGLTVDQYAFMTIELTSGANAGFRRTVVRNTATQIFVSQALGGAASGDTFRIVRPAVLLTFTVDTDPLQPNFNYTNGMRSLSLVNLAITNSVVGTGLMFNNYGSYSDMTGVELRSNVQFWNRSTQLFAAANAGYFYGGGYNVPGILGLSIGGCSGWGLVSLFAGNDGLSSAASDAAFNGYYSCVGAIVSPSPTFVLRGGRCSNLLVDHNNTFVVFSVNFFIVPTSAAREALAVNGRFVASQSPVTIIQDFNNYAILVGQAGVLSSAGAPFVVTSAAAAFPAVFVQAGGRMSFSVNSLTVTSTASAAMVVHGTFTSEHVVTLTGLAAGAGALQVLFGGSFQSNPSNGALTVSNTSTAASSDGVRITSGGRMELRTGPVVTTAGISGYGVNCRGTGQFITATQPSGVVGPTADFSVGSGGGEDFPDTDLAASLSFKASGLSVAQRST